MADVFRFPSTPPQLAPTSTHRTTFFTMVDPSRRLLTCAAYDVAAGLELRLSYADEDVMRSELFHGVEREEQVAQHAALWRTRLLQNEFVEIDSRQ